MSEFYNEDWQTPWEHLLSLVDESPLNRDLLYVTAGEVCARMLNAHLPQLQDCIETLSTLTLAIATGRDDDAIRELTNFLKKCEKKGLTQ